MIGFLCALALLPAVLIAPGWYWAKKRYSQTWLLLFLPTAGIVFWMLLTFAGVGPQSLSNLIEVFFVAVAAIAAAYLKFLLFDRIDSTRSRGNLFAVAIVVVVTIGLRLFMPWLPE